MKTIMFFTVGVCIALPTFATEGEKAEMKPSGERRVWESRSGAQALASLIGHEGSLFIFENAAGKRLKARDDELSERDLLLVTNLLEQHSSAEQGDQNEDHGTHRPETASTLVNLVQNETPLRAIENALDLIGQATGAQLANSLQGKQYQTVTQSYTVQVPMTRQVTELEERWEWRCIRGRWTCVRVLVPVQRQVQEYRQEQRESTQTIIDDNFVTILEALQTYDAPPTTDVERNQIKSLLLQAYVILSKREGE